MAEENKTLLATLSEARDALTTKVLQETLDFLEQESGGFERNCTIVLDAKATYALSRPRFHEAFTTMLVDRLRPRYVHGKRFYRRRGERERPRFWFSHGRGPVTFLNFKIGGTPEEIAQELGASRPQQPQRPPAGAGEPEGVPF